MILQISCLAHTSAAGTVIMALLPREQRLTEAEVQDWDMESGNWNSNPSDSAPRILNLLSPTPHRAMLPKVSLGEAAHL